MDQEIYRSQMRICEHYTNTWVGQPVNTLSNIGYLIVAIYLLGVYQRQGIRSDLYFSVLTLLVGIASALTHSSPLDHFLYFDYVAQFIFFSYMITLGIQAIAPTARIKRIGVLLFLSGSAAFLFLFERTYGVLIVASLAAIFVGTKVLGFRSARRKNKKIEYTYLIYTIGCFGVAFSFFLLDYNQIACRPDNHLFQFHGVWHFLVAISIVFIARFYRQFLWKEN